MFSDVMRNSLFALVALALLSPAAAEAAKPPETTPEGLVLRPGTRLQLVYLKPDADFTVYDQIALLPSEVAFKKNWERDYMHGSARRMGPSKADMDKIRTELGKLFDEILAEEVTKAGYPLGDHKAPDVLVIRPAIADLTVTAPDTSDAFASYTIAHSAGGMTLILGVFDSTTAELLGQAFDREEARDTGFMTWQNAVTNRGEAEKILRRWATTLVQGLGDLGAHPGQ